MVYKNDYLSHMSRLDYRELNQITTKGKFLILIIDELLDEFSDKL